MLKKLFQTTVLDAVTQFPDVSRLLEQRYFHQVEQHVIQYDEAQFIAIQHYKPY